MCTRGILVALASLSLLIGSRRRPRTCIAMSPWTSRSLLKELNIDSKKVPSKTGGVSIYDFERNGFKIRLHNYGGEDSVDRRVVQRPDHPRGNQSMERPGEVQPGRAHQGQGNQQGDGVGSK